MNNYSNDVKEKLTTIIKKMEKTPENFVENPNKDFTRKRKLTFEYMIKLLLSNGGNNLNKEKLEL